MNASISKKHKIDLTKMSPKDQLQNFFEMFHVNDLKVLEFLRLDEATFCPVFSVNYKDKIFEMKVSRILLLDMIEFWKSENAISLNYDTFLDLDSIKEVGLRVYSKLHNI